MEAGNIVEYIERQKILCAVVLEVKDRRLRLLTENNREVNMNANRLSHACRLRLDLSRGREKAVEALKEIAQRREQLIHQVDIRELWEVLNTEQEWIDLETMTAFCFPTGPTDDHKAAVIRAFFRDRMYFKFNPDRFFPYTQEQVDQEVARQRETERRERLIADGIRWITAFRSGLRPLPELAPEQEARVIAVLRSTYLFGKESEDHALGREMATRSGLAELEDLFPVLVKAGVWSENENTDLLRLEIPVAFPDEVTSAALKLFADAGQQASQAAMTSQRRDLTRLPLITIDGQSTLDYDDALSVERYQDGYRIGIHIVDVAHHVRKESAIDFEALARGSSIYMPDSKIPMLPGSLAEDLCSLKAGEIRPALSTLVIFSPAFEIVSQEVFPSLVKVHQQLSYYDVNTLIDGQPDFALLRDIAAAFHSRRMAAGAVQITLPEIHVWVSANGEVTVNRINRESPGRMLVSELMIMANWLMARFLKERGLSAVFRSQPEPKERLYRGDSDSIFQNVMQRRLLSRFVLNASPENHSGLGLEVYTTATSPIRKYWDLITQRQIRSAFGLESPYSSEEIDGIIQKLELPMGNVARLQQRRLRYWILKFLEKRVGQKEEAIVLLKRRRNYQVLIPEYMIECDLPLTSGVELKPQDIVRITLQRVDARKDVLTAFIG